MKVIRTGTSLSCREDGLGMYLPLQILYKITINLSSTFALLSSMDPSRMADSTLGSNYLASMFPTELISQCIL